jgi:deoxycitidine kinase
MNCKCGMSFRVSIRKGLYQEMKRDKEGEGNKGFRLITVEGVIGAGKSTLLAEIGRLDRPDVIVLQEPVSRWCEPVLPSGKSMLEAYYSDKKANALSFQMYAMLTRVQQLSELLASVGPEVRFVIAERGSWSDYEVFGRPMREAGLLSETEWCTYTAWFEAVTVGVLSPPIRPSGVVYIRADPEVCLGRIKKRDRHGEEEIGTKYLTLLNGAHEDYIASVKADVLVIDGNREGEDFVGESARDVLAFVASLPAPSSTITDKN